jgi:ABC-type multidrug transport system fused ATPase/permease subunit
MRFRPRTTSAALPLGIMVSHRAAVYACAREMAREIRTDKIQPPVPPPGAAPPKTYRIGKVDVPALRGVSFEVERGEFLSVVGPSGSGKSTLFYILGGLAQADSGRVLIDGTDFAHATDSERTHLRRRKIGFVFQKFNLLPTLTARNNIRDCFRHCRRCGEPRP